jgi:hypothetical protein
MFSRPTSTILKEDIFPRLLQCGSRCSQTSRRRSPAMCWRSQDCCRRFEMFCRHPQACCLRFLNYRRGSQLHPKISLAFSGVSKCIALTLMVLLQLSSEIPVTPKAGLIALLRSDTLLELTHLGLHCKPPLRHSWRLTETIIHFADVQIPPFRC